jgi:hypothetical protein
MATCNNANLPCKKQKMLSLAWQQQFWRFGGNIICVERPPPPSSLCSSQGSSTTRLRRKDSLPRGMGSLTARMRGGWISVTSTEMRGRKGSCFPPGFAEYAATLISPHTPSTPPRFQLWSASSSVEMGRSRGVETSQTAVGVDRNDTSSAYMAGEASAYVQSFGLKAAVVVCLRLSNSPVTRGQPR